MQKSASARKRFRFHHPLKYESIEFIMEWAAIHLFRFYSTGDCYRLLSLHTSHSVLSYISFCTSLLHLSLSLSLSSIFLPTPSPSYHHLNVVMLSWQLKCFLSACWVNWLSQKCILAFTLKYKSTHTETHIHAVCEIFMKCFIQQSYLLFMKASSSPVAQSVLACRTG